MQIRLWKLGNLEHGIIPSKEALDNFKKLLETVLTDDIVDIVWGPDITCEVVNTPELIKGESIRLLGHEDLSFNDLDNDLDIEDPFLSKLKEDIRTTVEKEVAKSLEKYFKGE